MRRIRVMAPLCALALGACSSAPTTADAPAAAATEAPARPVGLQDARNDADVLAVVTPVLECEWTEGGEPKFSCEANKAYSKAAILKEATSDLTLVNLTEDPDPKVRLLGAKALSKQSKAFKTDAELAARLIESAKQETEPAVGLYMGLAIGRIDTEATGSSASIIELFSTHEVANLRRGVLSNFLVINGSPEHFEPVSKAARGDADAQVRVAAATSLWRSTNPDQVASSCGVWLAMATEDGAPAEVVFNGMGFLGSYRTGGGCTEQRPELVGLYESHAARGGLDTSLFSQGLKGLYERSDVSEDVKARLMAAARKVVSDASNAGGVRGSTLRFIGQNDPAGADFAAGFVDDEEYQVKTTAKDIVSGKIAPK